LKDRVLNNFKSTIVLERFAIPKMFLVPKVTSNPIGCNFGATIESTSIYPPSLYSSCPCVPNSVVNPECACTLLESKGGITKALPLDKRPSIVGIVFHLFGKFQMLPR